MGFWSTVGGALGGIGGFMVGGPTGAVAGYQAGSSLGGGVDGKKDKTSSPSTSSGSSGFWDGMGSSLLSGGASLLGGYFQNQNSAAAADKQMSFQDRMSSTAYQRATADMIKAGLNPALAYSNGGASTPGGSSYNATDILSPAVNNAMAAKRLNADLDLNKLQQYATKAQGVLNDSLAAKAMTDAQTSASQNELNKVMSGKVAADTVASLSSARQTAITSDLLEQNMPRAKNLADLSKSAPGHFIDNLGYYLRSLNPLGSGMNSAKALVQ